MLVLLTWGRLEMKEEVFGLPLVCMSHNLGSVECNLCKTFIKDPGSPARSADRTSETISRYRSSESHFIGMLRQLGDM